MTRAQHKLIGVESAQTAQEMRGWIPSQRDLIHARIDIPLSDHSHDGTFLMFMGKEGLDTHWTFGFFSAANHKKKVKWDFLPLCFCCDLTALRCGYSFSKLYTLLVEIFIFYFYFRNTTNGGKENT